ncbi:TIGR01244 family sulfur transferase [Roseicyclus marinus]|uniref:TIGR01244 family sulfur transferase n=1 Tax=Roseicyclus marinus TaxID=2161673 RepID=UPI00240FA51C|nr:TIGR01244 family sulfur transferase [Roseicyclus marinus]MDG3042939.1 TIGR01244 family sulfur transferase [Roseicyclus marinus]
MTPRKITETLSVSEQITAADLPALAAQGYRSIICNRPDGEEPGQPPAAEIEAAARDLGLGFALLPVTPATLDEAAGRAFGKLVRDLPGPVLAYCRSGARSSTLWSLADAQDPASR